MSVGEKIVANNLRKMRGSFFTPKIWADKSKEYIAKVFSENWQDEYYVWDCAAGTGNLLAGLSNEYNVWASDIDAGNVETMQSLIDIDENLNLLSEHIFQFDFLNDSFDKLPEELKKIIDDSEKRKKLIVYINPPYAEASSYGVGGKPQVANGTVIFKRFRTLAGAEAMNELSAQFFIRIYDDIPDSKLAVFSTPKFITSHKFLNFRNYFRPLNRAAFICPANTFDNVDGNFPVMFSIWDTGAKNKILSLKADILVNNAEFTKATKKGRKTFYATNELKPIGMWRKTFYDSGSKSFGSMIIVGPSVQSNNNTFITNNPAKGYIEKHMTAGITAKNLIEMSIYFAVRMSIQDSWIVHNDIYFYPDEAWRDDSEFQNDCLVFTLFHGKNDISCKHGANRWIPFTETEVGAREKFESAFMSEFLKERNLTTNHTNHSDKNESIKEKVRGVSEVRGSFSYESCVVLDAGRELWKYYHAKTKDDKTASHNASFYDIREYFQGRKASGNMNAASTDETYNALLAALRGAMKALTAKIQPKVYEYGFLRE